MTIEERAKEFARLANESVDTMHCYGCFIKDNNYDAIRHAYTKGATDQKKIDDATYFKDMAYIARKKQEWIERDKQIIIGWCDEKWMVCENDIDELVDILQKW